MKRHPAYGLLIGEGANINDCGAMFKSLDAAKVPIFIKGQNTARAVDEVQHLREKSGVPHVTVFRQHGIHDFDRPDYTLNPKEAAVKHLKLHETRFPRNLDWKETWFETTNEIAKWFEFVNQQQINVPLGKGEVWERKVWEGTTDTGETRIFVDNANWMGWFACEISELMLKKGYKHIAFSWNTGEPEDWQWETDGVLAYLRLCQQHHERLGVGIHEYSGVTDGLLMRKTKHGTRERVKVSDVARQNVVGRFQNTLVATCNKHNIAIPKFCVTEGGWEHHNISVDNGVEHLKEAGEVYFQYEQCLGFALWGSVPEYHDISHKVQKLFALQNGQPGRLTNYLINTQYEVKYKHGGWRPTITKPVTPPPTKITPKQGDHYKFVKVTTSQDMNNAPQNAPLSITWTVQNTGTTTWNSRYHFGYAGVDVPETKGLPSGAMGGGRWRSLAQVSGKQQVAPGETVELTQTFTTPSWAGMHASHWRLHNQDNKFFGDTFWVKLRVR